MLRGLGHICYIVADLDRSIGWYEKLGCRVAFDFINDDNVRFGVYLHVGGRNFIELFQGTRDNPANEGSFAHMCLEVDDIESQVADLRSKGIDTTDIKTGSDGSYQAWLADPDGNRIELHQYLPDSRQGRFLG